MVYSQTGTRIILVKLKKKKSNAKCHRKPLYKAHFLLKKNEFLKPKFQVNWTIFCLDITRYLKCRILARTASKTVRTPINIQVSLNTKFQVNHTINCWGITKLVCICSKKLVPRMIANNVIGSRGMLPGTSSLVQVLKL